MDGSLVKKIIGVLALLVVVAFVLLAGKLFEYNDATTILVLQYPNGTVRVEPASGIYGQWFGKVEKFRKSFQFWFSEQGDQGSRADESILCRFNDGGHANISGSCRIIMPTDVKNMRKIYENYGSQSVLEHELIKPQLQKAVYFSGPLMSSKESAGVKRTSLAEYISDQAKDGVYETSAKEVKEPDPITGEIKTVSIVQIDREAKTGVPVRLEPSPLDAFGIGISSMSLNKIKYDDAVEKQITQQQQLTMQIQTAVAEAKTAEQQSLTAKKQGEANAAKAEWEQKTIAAKEVALAEQNKAVATVGAEKEVSVAEQQLKQAQLVKQTAELTKQTKILLGEGEAQAKRLAMEANGALEIKLEAWVSAQKAYAEALSKYQGNIVPQFVWGGGNGAAGTASATDFMSLLMANQAQQLSLDMRMQGQTMTTRPAVQPAAVTAQK